MDFAKRLLSFKGRASRAEFWSVHLLTVPVQLLVIFSMLIGGSGGGGNGIISLDALSFAKIAAAFADHRDQILLVLLLPLLVQLAAGARRLHDRDRSAWWLALYVAPLFVSIVLDRIDPSRDGPGQLGLAAIFLISWYFIELGMLEGSFGINSYDAETDPSVVEAVPHHEIEHEEPLPDHQTARYSAAEAALDRAIAAQAMNAAGKTGATQPFVERRQGDRRQGDRRVGMPDTREVKIERRGADRRLDAAAGGSQGFGRRRIERPA